MSVQERAGPFSIQRTVHRNGLVIGQISIPIVRYQHNYGSKGFAKGLDAVERDGG